MPTAASRLNAFVAVLSIAAVIAAAAPVSTLPSSVDWRRHGYVGPVINTLEYPCTAAAPANAVATNIAGLAAVATGHFAGVSTQETLECVYGTCDLAPGDYFQVGRVYDWYANHRNGSVTSSAFLPYVPGPLRPCNLTGAPAGVRVAGWRALPRGDEEAMRRAVAVLGPIVVSINALPLLQYTGGVFNESECRMTRHPQPLRASSSSSVSPSAASSTSTAAMAAKSTAAARAGLAAGDSVLDYVAAIVGYDVAAPNPYWIVRFGFGVDFGEGGYVRLQYGRNACYVAEQPVTGVLAAT